VAYQNILTHVSNRSEKKYRTFSRRFIIYVTMIGHDLSNEMHRPHMVVQDIFKYGSKSAVIIVEE
jgi:ribosomal protein S19